jgi:hypothetical protein
MWRKSTLGQTAFIESVGAGYPKVVEMLVAEFICGGIGTLL